MAKDMSYEGLNARKTEIMQAAIGVDYNAFELPGIGFDYERMMREAGYPMEKMREIQRSHAVGDTPLIELRNLTRLARRYAPAGKGANTMAKAPTATAGHWARKSERSPVFFRAASAAVTHSSIFR